MTTEEKDKTVDAYDLRHATMQDFVVLVNAAKEVYEDDTEENRKEFNRALEHVWDLVDWKEYV